MGSKAFIGTGAHRGAGVQHVDDVRRTWLTGVPNDRVWGWLYDAIWEFANETNERLWRFPIARETMEIMQYSVYMSKDRGSYDWHEDIGFHSESASRVLSATVQLTEESAYSGGDLQLRIGGRAVAADRRQGWVTLFP